MMISNVVTVESGTIDGDVQQFRAIYSNPMFEWMSAVVDKFCGLTLVCEDRGKAYGVNFHNVRAGSRTPAAFGAATILQEAGFGPFMLLFDQVATADNITLRHPRA